LHGQPSFAASDGSYVFAVFPAVGAFVGISTGNALELTPVSGWQQAEEFLRGENAENPPLYILRQN